MLCRLKHNDEFNAIFYTWLIEHTKQEVFDEADKVRYPVAPVYTTEELMNNVHYNERNFFAEYEHPVAGKLKYPGPAFNLSEDGYACRMAAPLLGQHNSEIYGEMLGYSQDYLDELKAKKII